jgi:hypothetical protein
MGAGWRRTQHPTCSICRKQGAKSKGVAKLKHGVAKQGTVSTDCQRKGPERGGGATHTSASSFLWVPPRLILITGGVTREPANGSARACAKTAPPSHTNNPSWRCKKKNPPKEFCRVTLRNQGWHRTANTVANRTTTQAAPTPASLRAGG